jgi:putative holliday junction resolvase
MTSKRVLAIDYGTKRLGIAVSDISGSLARPVTVIHRTGLRADLASIGRLVEEHDVDLIVVGMPRTLAGELGKQAAEVETFIGRLKDAFDLPVDRYDERLSSKEAKVWLAEMGLKGRKAKESVDKVAATLVLQSYLDKKTRGASL